LLELLAMEGLVVCGGLGLAGTGLSGLELERCKAFRPLKVFKILAQLLIALECHLGVLIN
jgi:hypothetical protein